MALQGRGEIFVPPMIASSRRNMSLQINLSKTQEVSACESEWACGFTVITLHEVLLIVPANVIQILNACHNFQAEQAVLCMDEFVKCTNLES